MRQLIFTAHNTEPIYRHEDPCGPFHGPDHPPFRYIGRKAMSHRTKISTAALCRSRYFLFRHKFQVMTRTHGIPNPDGKDHRPPATFARERKGTFRANRTDLPNPGGTGTDPERRNTTTKRKKKRKKTKNKKERHKKKEQRQEEKKTTPTQETQQEQEHSNNTPKPKPRHKKKSDARLAPHLVKSTINGGFPTKLSILRRFSHRYRPAKRRPAWPSYRNSGMRAT